MVTVRSAKAKGRNYQKEVADEFIQRLDLDALDVKCAVMGENGIDVRFFGRNRDKAPFAVECKRTEAINIHRAFEQASANADGQIPIVVFRRNRDISKVCLSLDDFLGLVAELNHWRHQAQ
jgi:hypothetical protein